MRLAPVKSLGTDTFFEEITRKLNLNLGGNQRELARLKNAKKQQELLKSKGANGQAGNQVCRLLFFLVSSKTYDAKN